VVVTVSVVLVSEGFSDGLFQVVDVTVKVVLVSVVWLLVVRVIVVVCTVVVVARQASPWCLQQYRCRRMDQSTFQVSTN
jgi:hypothetical protein